MRVAFSSVVLLSVLGTAHAANRCVDEKGKVTYQDAPCATSAAQSRPVDTSDALTARPSSSKPGMPDAAGGNAQATDPAYSTAKGQWRGPVQFQYSLGGVRDEAAQVVTPMVVELKNDGEVIGVIMEAGCKVSGLTTQFVAPNAASVDVSLKGCKDSRFNARFNGYLNVSGSAKEAKLTLNAIAWTIPSSKIQQASLEAVLRR